MKAGDYVLLEPDGRISFVGREALDENNARTREQRGEYVGIVVEVREPPDNTVVQMRISRDDVEPPRATIGTLRRIFG